MRKLTLIIVLFIIPLMANSANRWEDGYQRTQEGDYTVGIDFDGNSFENPSVYYYFTDKLAGGVSFNYALNKTTLPNDNTETNSDFMTKLGARYEFCGDNSPVIGHSTFWGSYEREGSSDENGVSSSTATNWFGVGVCVGGEIYFNKQLAVGLNADLGLRFGSESSEFDGQSSDGNSYTNFRLGFNPKLNLMWNFN